MASHTLLFFRVRRVLGGSGMSIFFSFIEPRIDKTLPKAALGKHF